MSAVTGMGVVAPNGDRTEDYWQAVLDGRSGLGPISHFDAGGYPVSRGGESPFVAKGRVPGRLVAETDRFTHMALAAAEMALADAGVDPAELPEYEMAVTTASSSGGTDFGQREIEKLWRNGPRHVGAYQSIAWFYAASTGQIAIRHKMRGPCNVVCAEQAGGLDAVAHSCRLLRDGVRLALAGGTDASLCPYGLVAQLSNRRLSPSGEFLPFDARADGYLPGEGGAMLAIEPADTKKPKYGYIAGHAATFDPPPWSDRPPALRRAVEAALADAGAEPGDIDVVFADAAGLPDLDRQEAEAVNAVFGPRAVPVTAPKTMTGRLYAGGAALDLATALLALRDQVIPPTIGITSPVEGLGLDLVRDTPRQAPLRAALVLARGYGGFNSAIVVRA
ncbi:ketosynthase chain-length factor [Nonomuraea cavernae]|uniref:Actinorhodin polyketide beta-ketoacyl synthase n=1 Tax=Nonomuraea cavernae TaxID=2045107 RepID=A0A917ZFR9_9ACTN|nr:ketosynthase chain-length factor [Nonomuraea cavernae]MCA2189473.1 ketosynthase chain-length factor [Nonomuraea cavernae]GGO82165.1 actinorhodin polyketide beta-ketoacyl synthase [Nonomuraea cavernae]